MLLLQDHNQFKREGRRILLQSNLETLSQGCDQIAVHKWTTIGVLNQHITMTSLVVTMDEDTNWTIYTQGPVDSRPNQLSIEEKTLYPSTNHGYGGRWWRYGSWCHHTTRWQVNKDGNWLVHRGSKWTQFWTNNKLGPLPISKTFAPT